jgi:hypothetical protein
MMVSGPLVHVFVHCTDSGNPETAQSLIEAVIVKSLEDATQDIEGEMEIDLGDPHLFMALAQSAASIAAIGNAAKSLNIGYYLGSTNDGELLLN